MNCVNSLPTHTYFWLLFNRIFINVNKIERDIKNKKKRIGMSVFEKQIKNNV